jgi:protein-S-isoprenylcysteine O-methyltransferase Ste14
VCDQEWTRVTTSSRISDQTSPDSTKLGEWLFRHRTALPLPIAGVILGLRIGQAPPSALLITAGVAVTAAGELIRLWGVRHIGAISRTRSHRLGPLVATGPFALIRNPLYVGNILIWVGFALSARLIWLAPLIVLLLGAEYHAIVRWEESLLVSRLGDAYRDYAARVPRWIPRLASARPSSGSGRAVTSPLMVSLSNHERSPSADYFSWRDTLFSERGTFVAIAVGYLLLWTRARF